jgi:hypothetical protein
MIDWIDDSGKMWGIAKRRIAFGGYWYANDGFHKDGFSARSVVDKLFESRTESAHPSPEVFIGEALCFEIGMATASEQWFYLAHYRYVIPNRLMPAKSKILELRKMYSKAFKDERAYYNELHGMHCFLLGRMPDVPRESLSAQSLPSLCAEDRSNKTNGIKVLSA